MNNLGDILGRYVAHGEHQFRRLTATAAAGGNARAIVGRGGGLVRLSALPQSAERVLLNSLGSEATAAIDLKWRFLFSILGSLSKP